MSGPVDLPGYGLRKPMAEALLDLGLLPKLTNYMLAEKELAARATKVKAKPYWLVVDPSSACELECPFCPTGKGKDTRPRELMDWERYKALMDELGPTLLHAEFCNWGEPLLNKQLPRMIRYAKKFGVETHLSSHFNRLDESVADRLIDSGLDWIIASVDGATQESYGRYRVGGDLRRVLANIERFAALKKKRGVRRPLIYWQFLVFRHNEREIEAARKLAASVGADSFGASAAAIPLPEWRPVGPGKKYYPGRKQTGTLLRPELQKRAKERRLPACVWPWLGSVVNAGGTVSPCCAIEDEVQDYGRVGKGAKHAKIWNGPDYQAARVGPAAAKSRPNACTTCTFAGEANIDIPGSWNGMALGVPLTDMLRPLPWPGPFKE